MTTTYDATMVALIDEAADELRRWVDGEVETPDGLDRWPWQTGYGRAAARQLLDLLDRQAAG